MNTPRFKTKNSLLGALLFVGLLSITTSFGQTKYTGNSGNVTIDGTSTLHDWNMKSASGHTSVTMTLKDGQITDVSALSFTVEATSLKSNKSGLDKNAYKALNTSANKNITYKATSGTVSKSGGNYIIKTNGTLTIGTTSKPLALSSTATVNSDNSVSVKGGATFNMSNYGVTPPTVMMGTIKTGDEITITYDTKLKN
ncbi:YceI family protein [Sphingobacterium olei]|uniref:YceI family protein n=1 Tax=Sphingobacterium olei TaxID=2571155 RepID=A0A4U0NHF2_9SPHI|nr:YceI family protein [Sphingobacterium olei]TJZ53609.1 YceI family protein [Sphingobacterium olei]